MEGVLRKDLKSYINQNNGNSKIHDDEQFAEGEGQGATTANGLQVGELATKLNFQEHERLFERLRSKIYTSFVA